MQNLMVAFTYSFFDQRYQFWGNLVQKIKIICLKWKLVPRLIRICRLEWSCLLFLFYIKNIFLGKLGAKNQNHQFKLKFDTYTNSNMQNSVVVFTFSALDRDSFFLANLVGKGKNSLFKLKFGTKTNYNFSTIQSMFILSVIDQKYPFLVNLLYKSKLFA